MNNNQTPVKFCSNCYFAIGLANESRTWFRYDSDIRPGNAAMVPVKGCEKCASEGGIDNAKAFLGKGYADLALEALAMALNARIVPNDDATTTATRHMASNGAFVPNVRM